MWREEAWGSHLQFINNSKQYRTQVVDGQRVRAGVRQIRVDGQAIRSRQAAGIVIGETVRVLHRQAEQTGNKRSEVITGQIKTSHWGAGRGERDIEPIKCMRSPHTSYRWRRERDIEPIKCMCSPHTSYMWRGERDRANQVYALTTHQLQVERRERHRANQVKSSHLYLYSAFNNTNCIKALHNIKIGKLCQ